MAESSGGRDRSRQNAVPPTREERERLLGLIGKEHIFTGAQDMLAAYKALPPRTAAE